MLLSQELLIITVFVCVVFLLLHPFFFFLLVFLFPFLLLPFLLSAGLLTSLFPSVSNSLVIFYVCVFILFVFNCILFDIKPMVHFNFISIISVSFYIFHFFLHCVDGFIYLLVHIKHIEHIYKRGINVYANSMTLFFCEFLLIFTSSRG